jgi:YjbE family integral membrane protein
VDLDLLKAVLSIVVIDLVLSGDNAVVIGMAARLLPPEQRRKAILFGAGGAIGLRVLFTALAAFVLGIPLLQALGGVLLLWIAFKLLRQNDHAHGVKEGRNLAEAVRTIVLADVIMSLDNILAVGGAAHGELRLLLFGLGLSMPIILFGSGLIARLMNRFPWLVYLGSGILAYTAMEMIFEDPRLGQYLPHATAIEYGIIALVVAAVLGLGYWLNARADRDAPPLATGAPDHPESHIATPGEAARLGRAETMADAAGRR